MTYLIVGGLVLIFLVAVLMVVHLKEMRDDHLAAGLFLLKVAIPLATIALIVLLNSPSR